MDNQNNYIKQLSQEMEQYNAGLVPTNPEPPQTFVIECNKTLAQQDGDSLRTNAWTNNFPPIKLKKGDVVSVNSAFLSTRGSGDLLQFDDSNNKTRLLFEYYATNDNANNKKPSFNIRGYTQESSYAYNANNEINCYPVNYRPMRLYRLLETFQTLDDFNNPTPVVNLITETNSTEVVPKYSKNREAWWGYLHAKDFIFSGIEDKYIPSLFRAPLVNIRETMFCSFNSETELDPTTEPYFGLNLKALRVWYISTQHSLYGACNVNATMRIYFGYGNHADGAEIEAMNTSTFNFLRRIRVGQHIQFKDADQVFGIYGDSMKWKNTTTGAITDIGGSSCYYCSGYSSLGEGIVRTIGNGFVDRFTQMGQHPPALANGNPTKLYDMSVKNPLGSIMKVVKINMVNGTRATKNGVASNYTGNLGDMWNDHGHMNMPWIEVQCDSAISIAFNDPNLSHADQVPCMGQVVANNSPTAENINLYCSPQLQLGLRTWYVGGNIPLTRTAKLAQPAGGQPALSTQYRNEFGTASNKAYPTNAYNTEKTELNEKLYLAFRPYYFSVQNGTPEVDGDYYGSANADKYASMDNAYGMRLVEDYLGINAPLEGRNGFKGRLGISAGEARTLAHNYNVGTTNKDNSLNFAYGEDILETTTYSGGRKPSFYRGFSDTQYDTPVGSATRVGYHNQGQSYNIYGDSNNRLRTGGFFDYNGKVLRNLESRTPNNQRKLQTDGDLYIENQLGLKTQFHFGNTILNVGEYDGSPIVDGTQFSAETKASNPNYANGSANFIVGARNLPKAYFKDGVAGSVDYKSGLWYGYAHATENLYRRPIQKGGYGLDQGVIDFRMPMSQFPSLFYAKFYDSLGRTEIMYIQCIYTPIQTNDADTVAKFNNVAGITKTTTIPSIVFTNAGSAVDDACAPAFYIIKRDCENTGKLKFLGIDVNKDGALRTFNIAQYNPLISLPTNPNRPNQLGSYFEILNDYAMAEHQVKFDNLDRDLIPLGTLDLTDDLQYQQNFGVDYTEYGNKCGGDFYLCKYPNMPFNESQTGIRRVIDNQIRLSSGLVKMGEPTRIDGISNYTGGGHTGKYEWDIHYDYVDLDISGDKVYYSPSDVANYITSQFHKPADLYKSWDITNGGGGRYDGGQWSHSAGSYPMNSLFRTIHGPSDQVGAGTDSPKGNFWDSDTGMLMNAYHEGDFIFFADIAKEVFENGINAYGFEGGALKGLLVDLDIDDSQNIYQVPASGKHPVWIQNNDFYLNTLPTTDSFNISGYGYSETTSDNTIRNFYNEQDMRGKDMRYKQYTFSQTFGSMFVGTNNAQLNYNTNVSRFEWKFLHQPNYSIFTEDSASGSTSGGNIIAKIWTERIKGYDNWDRYGGVNITNWCMPVIARGSAKSRRDVINDPLLYQDPVGLAFMNKLGFSSTWISQNQGSTDYNDVADYSYKTCYKPLGTTASDYDISQSKPYTQVNPLLMTQAPDGDMRSSYSNPTNATTNLAYLQVDNSLTSIGGKPAPLIANASASDLSYNGANPFGKTINPAQPSTDYDRSDGMIKNLGATLGYGFVNTKGSPPSVRYDLKLGSTIGEKVPTDLNLDDVKFFSYDIEVDSNSIQADELPKKTLIGYFLIMSDIIDKHEFIGSANNGSPLKCIGILSKNYENSDFYFSFQSPVEFYIKQDRTITSIKTEIMTPQLDDPAGLDYNSSIIYTVVRQNNEPEPDVPPIAIQQALDYALMEKMSGQLGIDMGNINPYSNAGQLGLGMGSAGGAGLNTLRQNLVDSVLHPSQDSASMIMATQSAISQHLSRMSLGGRARMLREGLSEDPQDMALQLAPPTPAQAQLEGLGISQPASLEEEPYLSVEQLEVEHANAVKKDDDSDSAKGGSIFSGAVGGSDIDAQSISSLHKSMRDDESTAGGIYQDRSTAPSELKTLPLGEFFSNYMRIASDKTRHWYKTEQKKNRLDVDNPASWSPELLKTWSGDWGDDLYKRIGGKLNLEATSRIQQAIQRHKTLDEGGGKAGASAYVAELASKRKVDIKLQNYGSETLLKRISRGRAEDPKTATKNKQLLSWGSTNPYDLRTYDSKRLSEYMEDKHFGVKEELRTPENRLSQLAHTRLQQERDRRSKGGKGSGKIQMEKTQHDGLKYKNPAHAHKDYNPHKPHETPHKNVSPAHLHIATAPPKPKAQTLIITPKAK